MTDDHVRRMDFETWSPANENRVSRWLAWWGFVIRILPFIFMLLCLRVLLDWDEISKSSP